MVLEEREKKGDGDSCEEDCVGNVVVSQISFVFSNFSSGSCNLFSYSESLSSTGGSEDGIDKSKKV